MKYIVLFIWAVLFLYVYHMFMPKGMLYWMIGIPTLYVSSLFIFKIFDGLKAKKLSR